MKITLYLRTYPVKDAPVAMSFAPTPGHQKHTYSRDGRVYEAVSRTMQVTVPDGSVFDMDRLLLCWSGDKGKVRSTVNEVYALVQAGASGFGTAS
jgi:hypothetical protein